MFWFAQFVGIMASTLNISKYFIKDKKILLVLVLGIYFFIGTTFILLEAYSGAIIYMLIGIMIMCQYMIEMKEINISKKIYILYWFIYLLAVIFSYKTIFDILPIVVAITNMILLLKQDDRRAIRIVEVVNCLLLTVYSIIYGGYTLVISSIVCMCLYMKDIYKYDIRKETEPVTELEVDYNEEKNRIERETERLEAEKQNNNPDNIVLTSNILRPSNNLYKSRYINGKNGGHKYNIENLNRYTRMIRTKNKKK